MEERYLEISEGEWLTDAFKRENEKEANKYPLNAIPTNCIFDKTLPGLGATRSEIDAKRPSIIIEPNVPVIVGKTTNKSKLLPVYEKIKDGKIEKYLLNKNIPYKKIICTPEGYMRVQKIALGLGINIYQDYFCLFDECEKITQDIDYRENIVLPIRDFFLFENKAFVSATPIEIRDKRFEEHGFFKLKVVPQFDYVKDIDLVVTNRYELTVIEKLNELRDSERICVFLNSTNGINKLITYLESRGITDIKAFCSQKSVIKFQDRRIKAFENLDMPLAKYNFFTSRFFSAVDIIDNNLPDILILTDLNEAKYSMIDPATNAIQIYGRFRNKIEGKKFNSLAHITNVENEEQVLSDEEINTYLDEAELHYNVVKSKLEDETDKGRAMLLTDDLRRLVFNRFIFEDGTKNEFSIDNFYEDEKIKRDYLTAENLVEAYNKTQHFNVNFAERKELIDDKILLRYKRLRSDIETRKLIVTVLEDLTNNGWELKSNLIEYVKAQFIKNEKREKIEVVNYILEAYEKLGGGAIIATEFYKTRIDVLLNKQEKETNHEKMFSKDVRNAVEQQIWCNKEVLKADALDTLTNIFKAHGITAKVYFTTLEKYGGVRELKGKDKKGYIQLLKFQPDEEFE